MFLTEEPRRLEIVPTIGEVADQINGVEKWSKPIKPAFSFNFAAMRPIIRQEAKGTVLIISPFNYPIWLSIGPLVRISSVSFIIITPFPICKKKPIIIVVYFRPELSQLVTLFVSNPPSRPRLPAR